MTTIDVSTDWQGVRTSHLRATQDEATGGEMAGVESAAFV
jgi:hypothetical protein